MKLSRCKITVLCCLLIAPMLLASCARRGAGEAETTTQRAEYTGNRTDLWDEEKNPPYTGDAWVPPGGDEPENPDPDEPEEPEQPDNPGDLTPELPDFDNAEFVMLSSADGFFVPEDWVDSDSEMVMDDPLSQALYARNMAVEVTLNIDFQIVVTPGSNIVNIVSNSVLSEVELYHTVLAPLNTASVLAGEGLYMNLYDLPWLEPDAEWWCQGFLAAAELNGSLPMATGALLPSLYRAAYVVYYNREYFGANELTELAERGGWTMEAFDEMARTLGAAGAENVVGSSFRQGFGAELTVREADGHVTLRGLDEKACDAMSLLSELWRQGEPVTLASNPDDAAGMFSSRQAALLVGRVYDAETIIKEGRVNFGILPMPKFDSSQTAYYTGASLTHGTVAVPAYKNAPDLDMVGIVLETLCAASEETVLTEYFTRTVGHPEDMELLESLQQMLRWDFMDVYCSQFGNSTYWENAFRQDRSLQYVYNTMRELMLVQLNELQS